MSEKFEVFKKEYGPQDDPGKTVYDEMLRAWRRVVKRFHGYGNKLGAAYGGEYVNYAGNYLGKICGGDVDTAVNALWGISDDETYEEGLKVLMLAICDYVIKHAEIANQKNVDDMWNYCSEDDFDGLWPEEESVDVDEDTYDCLHPWAVYDPQ